MESNFSDISRKDFKIYLEPVLATACDHQAGKVGCKTRSKYIRYAVIRALIQDGYPLDKVSDKFLDFYNCSKIRVPNRGMTYNK
jgi:hypothetical protein